jgi:hypothetical protein
VKGENVNDTRQVSLSDFEQPFEVVHHILRRGNSKAIAKHLGRTHTSVDLWGGDPEQNRHGMPASAVVPFTLAAGDTLLIEWFCEEVGGVFVRIPQAGGRAGLLGREIAKLMRESADVLEEYSKSMDDGELSQKERQACIAQLDEQIRQAVKLRSLLEK